MKKIISCAFLALGLFCLASRSEAASAARGAKEIKTFGYSTAISSVTPFTVLQSTSGFLFPGVVYGLILSTGATGDFAVLLDSNSALGYGTGGAGSGTNALIAGQIGPRYFFGSTSTVTSIVFDPPLFFFNGLEVQMSASTDQLGVVFEEGRNASGQ